MMKRKTRRKRTRPLGRGLGVAFTLVGLAGLACPLVVPTWAQDPAAPEESPATNGPRQTAANEVASDSPRAAVSAYLELTRAGSFEEAARYLLVSPERAGVRAQLAERLKAVLDRHLWIDLDSLSGEPSGTLGDGLPADVDQIGTVPLGRGDEPVRLVKTEDDDGAYWAFSRGTVGRIDRWYYGLSGRWLRETMPALLLRPGPRELLWWQWLALPLLLLVAWGAGRLLGSVTRRVLSHVFARTRTSWDDRLLDRSAAPLTLGWMLIVAYVLLPSLELFAPADAFARSLLAAAGVVVVFWLLWSAVDICADALRATPWAEQSPSARSLLAVGGNLLKGFVAAAGAVAMLTELGYPVATLLAGLGIGGIAFAFGAQKTIENLFGSIALAVDRPFQVGDFVKVEDFVGTVEDIGLRSTRFRTLDRTVISIPNGKVADMKLESFAPRDRLRFSTTIGLEYGTSHAQMQQVLLGFERVLREHPKIWPDAVAVKFSELAASSLDIEVTAMFDVPTWADFQLCRQEVLLGFMRVVEDAGTGFAFPTQTVHVVGESQDAKREVS